MPSTATSILDGISTSVAVKAPVVAVTAGNNALTGLQGYTEDDRILVWQQTTASQNGIYSASSGSWTRTKDFDGNRDVRKGTLVPVEGSAIMYRVTSSNPIVIGTSSIAFEAIGPTQTQNDIALLLYPRTATEIAAGVTPSNYAIPSHEAVCEVLVERYGFDASDTTSDQSAALDAAYDVAVQMGGGVIEIPQAEFRASITIEHAGIVFRGQGGGGGQTLWRNFDATAPVTFSNASRAVYGSGLERIRFQNRDSGTYTTTDGVVITSEASGLTQMDYLTFKDLYFLQFRDNVSITGRTIWNEWDRVRFEGALRDGLHVEASNNISMQKFNLCRFGNSARHGVYMNHTFADPAAGWSFDTCNFEHNAYNGVRFTGSGGFQAFTFVTCYLEENTNSIAAHATNPDKSDIWIDCAYALGVNFINLNLLANTAPAADPDWGIYVNTDVMTQAHGSIDGCRFTSYVQGSVHWKQGSYLGKNAYGGGATGNTVDRAAGSIDLNDIVGAVGQFTPTVSFGGASVGVTYSNQVGRYARHGNFIFFTVYVALTAKGSSTGSAAIGGLPVTSLNVTNLINSVSVSGDSLGSSVTNLLGRVAPNGTSVTLHRMDAGSLTALADTDFGNSSAISISGVIPVL